MLTTILFVKLILKQEQVTDLHIQDNPIASLGDLAFAPDGLLYSTEALTFDQIDMSDEILQINLTTNDKLQIIGVTDKFELSVYSINGQLIKEKTMTNGEINIADLKQGVYIVKIRSNDKVIMTKQIIKE